MNKSVVRVGDYCVEVTPHFCISGSNNVFVNGKHRTDIKPVKPERNSYFLLF